MKTVFKYELKPDLDDRCKIEMPARSRILSVDFQGSALNVWVLVDRAETEKMLRVLLVKGTGHDIGYDTLVGSTYLGSPVHPDVPLVMHVWDLGWA